MAKASKAKGLYPHCPVCDKPLMNWGRGDYDWYCPSVHSRTLHGIFFKDVWNGSSYDTVEVYRIEVRK